MIYQQRGSYAGKMAAMDLVGKENTVKIFLKKPKKKYLST